jgi:predicted O-methyltransferase YrrM
MDTQILYGSDEKVVDVTDIIKQQLKSSLTFTIPSGDHERAELFGDPAPFTLKRIYVKRDNFTESHSKNVTLTFNQDFEITVEKTVKSAVVSIAKFEKDYIVDFVRYHLLVGFTKIFIYDNEDTPVYQELFKNYGDKVTVIHFPGNSYHKAVQYAALEHFINNYINEFTHVAHIDIDEYIVLKQHKHIHDFIKEYMVDDCAGIAMNWRHFGSNGYKSKTGLPDIFRFTKCEDLGNTHIKTIFDVSAYAGWSTCHCVATQPGKYIKTTRGDIVIDNHNEKIDFSVIQLNHYKSKTYREFQFIRTRGRADLLIQPQEDVVESFNKYNLNEIEDYTAAIFYSGSLTNFLNVYNSEEIEGYCEQVPQQLTDLKMLLQKLKPRNILEIGFNGAHSSNFFLENSQANVVSFDLNEHGYVKYGKIYIDTLYENRHTLITGDSTKCVPEYHHSKFDLIFIDGGHTHNISKTDLHNCKRLAHPSTIVIMDDTCFNRSWLANWNIGPNKAWTEAKNSGLVKEIATVDYTNGRGMSWGVYNFKG